MITFSPWRQPNFASSFPLGIYHIQKARKGEIYIWLEQKQNYNFAYFKDTSAGICKKSLPFLFDEFFSMTENGTGVGLTFCKLVMRELGGNITVDSVEGEYTTFIMSFPKLAPFNETK